jgi:hypothetical protein
MAASVDVTEAKEFSKALEGLKLAIFDLYEGGVFYEFRLTVITT